MGTSGLDKDGKPRPEAMPLIPKQTFDFKLPPKCPVPGTNFIQLRMKIETQGQS
jgi:hypothetical protein